MSETTPGPLTLALDIGGTGLKAGRLDPRGVMQGERLRVRTPHPSPPDAVLAVLIELANAWSIEIDE